MSDSQQADIGAAAGRLESKIAVTDTGCHEWQGSRLRGYGSFWMNGRLWRAHRAAWTLFRSPIPKGMCVLHTCDSPGCVNIEHLYLGTQKDNSQDRKRRGRHPQHQQTHCKRGHLLSGGNLYKRADGHRDCRACNKIRSARAYLKRKANQ